MRRAAIALTVALMTAALIPAAASARGPQKNDSVSGHGLVAISTTVTDEFRVSAHTLSSTTTLATGNMYLKEVVTDATGTATIQIWADVYCLVVVGIQAEVRGHIYRTEPDLLTEPTDLTFIVSDLNPVTSNPDLFGRSADPVGLPCPLETAPNEEPIAKGNITVNDEAPSTTP